MTNIIYHGTTKENSEIILKKGFKTFSYFTQYLDTAMVQGGNYVFAVCTPQFPEDFKGWEWRNKKTIPPTNILRLINFSYEKLYFNDKLSEKIQKETSKENYPYKDWKFCKTCAGHG